MPAVFLEITLEASRKVSVKALLNSGAQDLEVVVPRSIWKQMGAKGERRCGLIFGGRNFLSETCKVKAEIRNPETGEVRKAELDCSVPRQRAGLRSSRNGGTSKTRCDTKHKKRETTLPLNSN